MKSYLILTLIAATIIIVFSCNPDNKEKIKTEVENLGDNGIKITQPCITDIKIIYPDPKTEAPDDIEFYITSSDAFLNYSLKNKTIETLLFIEGGESSEEESRFGSGIGITELKKNYFKLHYTTSHFRGYPIDTVEEKGSDFIQTAQLVLTNGNGRQWNIKTCSQRP